MRWDGDWPQTYNCEGICYLTSEDLVTLNTMLIRLLTPNEPIQVLQPDLLESSQQSPSQYAYHEQSHDMFEIASVLIASLCQNHIFLNANKRTAFAAGCIFLLINGYEVTGPDHEVVQLMEALAKHDIDRTDVENWLAYWSHTADAAELTTSPGSWLEQFVAEHTPLTDE